MRSYYRFLPHAHFPLSTSYPTVSWCCSEDVDGAESQVLEQLLQEVETQASLSPAELQEEHQGLADADLQGNTTALHPEEQVSSSWTCEACVLDLPV